MKKTMKDTATLIEESKQAIADLLESYQSYSKTMEKRIIMQGYELSLLKDNFKTLQETVKILELK